MKSQFSLLIYFLSITVSFGQWSTNGSKLYYSSGNVGIGISNPSSIFHVYSNQYGAVPFRMQTPAGNLYLGDFEDAVALSYDGEDGWIAAYAPYNSTYYFGGSTITVGNGGVTFNKNVGIGKAPSTFKLDVNGSINATGLYVNGVPFSGGGGGSSPWTTSGANLVYNGGNVGIGANPDAYTQLNVAGRLKASTAYLGYLYFTGKSILTADDEEIVGYNDLGGNSNYWFAAGLLVGKNGKIGIGTSSPDYKLTVKGVIHSESVRVDLTVPGPDYVFEKDYQLTPLDELKLFLDENKHLPEVPSSDEMQANGIDLKEMNLLLLKKVEELTLYVLEQNELIQDQNRRIERLEQPKN